MTGTFWEFGKNSLHTWAEHQSHQCHVNICCEHLVEVKDLLELIDDDEKYGDMRKIKVTSGE